MDTAAFTRKHLLALRPAMVSFKSKRIARRSDLGHTMAPSRLTLPTLGAYNTLVISLTSSIRGRA